MTVDEQPLPTAYAGLTRDQAVAQVFFKRIRAAEGLGMSRADQLGFHEEFAAATTLAEKQMVIRKVFDWCVRAIPGKR